jgi:3-oxoacyl-[acyl-carrier protein] reductase
MDLGLRDKVIMVAAASKGLGLGIASAAAAEGAHLSLGSRTEAEIRAAATNLSDGHGVRATGHVMDASDAGSISRWTAQTLAEFGRIDGLVVNAGGPPAGKFDSFDDSDWESAFNLTLMSAVRMTRSVLPVMRDQGSGSILTITSSSIKEPIDILLLSNVYRAGVVALVKSLSRDLAAEGVRINNLVPGQIDTDRVRSNDRFAAERQGKTAQEIARGRQAQIPMGRYGSTAEFGRVGTFLLSDAASYMTGATVMVDGGRSRTIW